MMRIYIAAKNRENAAALRCKLVDIGCTVTSTWIDCAHYGSKNPKDRAADAAVDLLDVEACDLLICLSEPEGINVPGGKHVELGYALGLGKTVFVLGRRENVFHYHPAVTVFDTEDEMLIRLMRRNG